MSKRCNDTARMRYHHKLSIALIGLVLQWGLVAVTVDALKREWKPVSQVSAAPAKPSGKAFDLAALTPACDVHDWGCIGWAAYDSGYQPYQPKRRKR